jgi:hypothetical protein
MRPGEWFGAICSREQLDRMRRVIEHNGGELRGCDDRPEGVFLTIGKC